MSAREKLKFLRNRHGLSQERLGDETGISRSHIANLETQEGAWPEEYSTIFAHFFKVPVSYFSDAKEEPKVAKELHRIWKMLLYREHRLVTDEQLALLKAPYPNLEQELQANMLLAIYFSKMFAFDEADKIKEKYVSNYLEQFQVPATPLTQQILHYFQLQFQKHKSYFAKGLETAEKLDGLLENEVDRLALKLTVVYLYFNGGNIEATHDLLASIEPDLLELGNDRLLSEYYIFLSATNIRLKLFNQAFKALDKLEGVAKRSRLMDVLAKAYQHRGVIYGREKKEHEKAIYYHKKGLDLVPPDEKGPYYRSIMANLNLLGRFEESAQLLKESRNINMTEEVRMGILIMESQIALHEGDMATHRRTHKESLEYYQSQKNAIVLRYIYGFLGDYYSKKNKFKKASEYFKLRDEVEYL